MACASEGADLSTIAQTAATEAELRDVIELYEIAVRNAREIDPSAEDDEDEEGLGDPFRVGDSFATRAYFHVAEWAG